MKKKRLLAAVLMVIMLLGVFNTTGFAYGSGKHTIKFTAGEHGTISGTSEFSVRDGDNFPNAPEVTPTDGYTFKGWNPELPRKATKSQTYEAQYKAIDYKVFYDGNGASGQVPKDNKTYNVGDNVAVRGPQPERTGYVFVGWEYNGTLYQINSKFKMPASNVTLKASWQPVKYSIVYNYEGGSASNPSEYTIEDVITLNNPTRTGYTFTGWSGSGISPGTLEVKLINTTGAKCYQAHWIINEYTVTFEDYDGRVIKTEKVKYEESATKPDNPSRVGYTFTGWSASFDKVTQDLTITAQYCINEYTVTFEDYDGRVIKTEKVKHGEGTTAPADPSRAGYTFTGWSAAYDKVTEDLKVTAQYRINEYAVKFESNGGSAVANTTAAYDTLITEPGAPTKQYHSFKGWYKDAELTQPWNFAADKIGAADLTLYAKWAADEITNLKSKETMYVGGRITFNPQPPNGTWSLDSNYLAKQDNNQFKALKEGVTKLVYTANGLTHTIEVTILKAKLPVTGQQNLWIWILGGLGLCAAAGASVLLLKKRQHSTSEK